MSKIKIAVASDHAGFEMKKSIINHLATKGYEFFDFGADSNESADYADYAHPLSYAVENGEYDLGITLCGSGNGINMVANKHQGIRSAICWNPELARLAKAHNNANICSLPARFISNETAVKIIDTFLTTKFEGGRHIQRIKKIPLK